MRRPNVHVVGGLDEASMSPVDDLGVVGLLLGYVLGQVARDPDPEHCRQATHRRQRVLEHREQHVLVQTQQVLELRLGHAVLAHGHVAEGAREKHAAVQLLQVVEAIGDHVVDGATAQHGRIDRVVRVALAHLVVDELDEERQQGAVGEYVPQVGPLRVGELHVGRLQPIGEYLLAVGALQLLHVEHLVAHEVARLGVRERRIALLALLAHHARDHVEQIAVAGNHRDEELAAGRQARQQPFVHTLEILLGKLVERVEQKHCRRINHKKIQFKKTSVELSSLQQQIVSALTDAQVRSQLKQVLDIGNNVLGNGDEILTLLKSIHVRAKINQIFEQKITEV